MSVQARVNNTTIPFIRSGEPFADEAGIIKQDASRVNPLAPFTVMGKSMATIPATMTPDGGNVGDGTVTAVDFKFGGPVMAGIWTLQCSRGGIAGGGEFQLFSPNLTQAISSPLVLSIITSATFFTIGGLVFLVTPGGTDFSTGDKFTVTVTAENFYIPLTLDGREGSSRVAGIYLGESITAAKIVAGNVSDSPMLVGGNCTFDISQIVFDGGVITLDSILVNGNTVRMELAKLGIFAETTIDIDSFET